MTSSSPPALPQPPLPFSGRLHVDVTACFDARGAPVGISRVVTELARSVRTLSPDSRAWRYDPACRTLVPVSWAAFDQVVATRPRRRTEPGRSRALVGRLPPVRWLRNALRGAWRAIRPGRVLIPLDAFEPNDRFIFGETISDDDRLQVYRSLLDERSLRTILYCHDMIPALFPELVEPATQSVFAAWLQTFARPNGLILCSSFTTARDLAAVCAPDPVRAPITVIPPGCDIVVDVAGAGPDWGGRPAGRYILYVSTIEVRKNHALLLAAYAELIARGRHDLPILLFVGRRGWMVDGLLREIDGRNGRARYVRILQGVGDAELAALYRGAIFTVYPSHYEGWGIPVSESLALGRFCLSSDRGALPEAGGDLVELLHPDDVGLWADRIAHYLDDPLALSDRELAIAAGFRCRTWADFRREVATVLRDG